jgi:hypothetical protein
LQVIKFIQQHGAPRMQMFLHCTTARNDKNFQRLPGRVTSLELQITAIVGLFIVQLFHYYLLLLLHQLILRLNNVTPRMKFHLIAIINTVPRYIVTIKLPRALNKRSNLWVKCIVSESLRTYCISYSKLKRLMRGGKRCVVA